jgi:RND family efflux transporter MFP subunit
MNILRFCLSSAILVLLFGCSKEVEPQQTTPVRVKTMTVSDAVNESGVYFPATAKASNLSELSFRVHGEIIQLHVNEGSLVKKGDILAELDPNDYQIEVENAMANYTVLDSQYKRSEPLVEKELLAQSQFDEIAAKRAIAKAELDLAKLQLSFTQLTAPFDGLISRVIVDNFQSVQTGQQVFNIHEVQNIDVLIQIPDQMVIKQDSGNTREAITSIVRTQDGSEYEASLKEYTTEPDPETGTYTVTLTMPVPEGDPIFDGMALEVSTKHSETMAVQSTLELPIEAIATSDGDPLDRTQKFVWIVTNGVVSKQSVVTGNLSSSTIAVTEGIETGDEIVIAGISRLVDGMEVVVVTQEAGQ